MKNAQFLLSKDLDSIVKDLEKWAKKNGITKDQVFFQQVDRIHNVASTLKMLNKVDAKKEKFAKIEKERMEREFRDLKNKRPKTTR